MSARRRGCVALRSAWRFARRSATGCGLCSNASAPRREQHPPPDVDLADALRRLPVRQRTCVLLFYFEDRPISEIVDILGISDGAVKVHLHRARQRLSELLREEVDEDAP